ncbi:kinetochore-associated protein KNL-2-like protein, partial [Striga asiatica]
RQSSPICDGELFLFHLKIVLYLHSSVFLQVPIVNFISTVEVTSDRIYIKFSDFSFPVKRRTRTEQHLPVKRKKDSRSPRSHLYIHIYGNAVRRKKRLKESPSTPFTSPNTAISSSLLKQVFLHDWWLIEADSGFDGKRLGVGGLTSKESSESFALMTLLNTDVFANQMLTITFTLNWWFWNLTLFVDFRECRSRGIRSFCSAPIMTRHDVVTLKTVDGVTVLLHGHLNMSRSLENGFSHEVCENFQIGFPYYWEEYAAISNGEDSTPGGNCTSNSCGNIFDEILKNKCDDAFSCGEGSNVDKGNPRQKIGSPHDKVKEVQRTVPLTRSRARLLPTKTYMMLN